MKAVIELLILACLGTGECRKFSSLYDLTSVSLITCMTRGQTQIALWQETHPGWEVKRWHCSYQAEGETEA